MEDIDYPPTNRLQKNIVPVAAATILAGLGWYFVSEFVNTRSDCPSLHKSILILCLGISWLLCVRALVFGPDGPIEQLIAVVLMMAIGLGLPLLTTGMLLKQTTLGATFCPECENRGKAEEKLISNPSEAFILAGNCEPPAKDVQIQALLNWSSNLMGTPDCTMAKSKIEQAATLAAELTPGPERKQLMQTVADKQITYADSQKCAPTPIPTVTPIPSAIPEPVPMATEAPPPAPTPTQVLAITLLGKRPDKGIIVFKLTADGTPVPGLTKADITLAAANQTPRITEVAPRTENSKVCVVAVIDNSGSIKEQKLLKGAIDGLNEMKDMRPNLELGMVVFDTGIVHEVKPSRKPLDANLITGFGEYTSLWLAMDAGIKLASNCAAPALDRYLFVVTDGADSGVSLTQADFLKKNKDSDIGICAVGIGLKEDQQKPLQDTAVGCPYRLAKDVGTVRGLLQEILYDTGNSYRITTEDPFECPVTLEVRGTSLKVCP